MTMAIKILDGLVAEDEARKMIADTFTVKRYIKKIRHDLVNLDDLDNLQNLLDTLLQIIMDDGKFKKKGKRKNTYLTKQNCIDALQNEIIDLGALDPLLDFLSNTSIETDLDAEDKEKLSEIKKAVMRVVIYATSTDSKMDSLYNNQHILSRFLAMMSSPIDVVQQCAVYALGNLARSGKISEGKKNILFTDVNR